MNKDAVVLEVNTPETGEIFLRFLPGNPITVCEILPKVGSRYFGIISYGIGVRKHGDNHDKVVGMKQALASALRKLDFPKAYKQMIWDVFFAKFPEAKPTSKKDDMTKTDRHAIRELQQMQRNLSFACAQLGLPSSSIVPFINRKLAEHR